MDGQETKHMTAIQVSSNGPRSSYKTRGWEITDRCGESVGFIAWHDEPQRYCFVTEGRAVLGQDFLSALADFLRQINDTRL